MLEKEKLLNQKVINKLTGETLVVVSANDYTNISDARITFNNGKTFDLCKAVSNNIIVFENDDLEKEILAEISELNKKQEERNQFVQEQQKIAIENAKKKYEEEIKTNKKKVNNPNIRIDRKNVAYKATYCDGNGNWFSSPCSESCRRRNCSIGGGRFCSTNSVCKRVIDGLSNENDVRDAYNNNVLCYESRILIDYKIYAGRDDDGTVRGWSLDNDRLVILTTVKPNQQEQDRVIFGAFLIKQSYDKDDEEASATSYPDCRLALTEQEAEKMKYWEYAPGEGVNGLVQWKEGLLRYQTDEMCATVLKDMVELIKKRNDPIQTAYAEAFLNKFLNKIRKTIDDIPDKSGALIQLNKKQED